MDTGSRGGRWWVPVEMGCKDEPQGDEGSLGIWAPGAFWWGPVGWGLVGWAPREGGGGGGHRRDSLGLALKRVGPRGLALRGRGRGVGPKMVGPSPEGRC